MRWRLVHPLLVIYFQQREHILGHAPAGLTSVSVVAVGAGAEAGAQAGGGGGLGWKNNISVTPGQSYTVVVGAGGQNRANQHSYFINTATVMGRRW